MKLLFSANSFYPAVGGYERIALLLAGEIARRGHSVKVITFTPEKDDAEFPFEIYRNPSVGQILRLIRWSDIYIQHNVSLRFLWPIIFSWRPVACIHHGFYMSPWDTVFSWRYRLKHFITRFCTNISVSKAISETLPGKSHVIPNPYRDDLFFRLSNIPKDRDLFFVGRIVSDKGVDLLIESVARLRNLGFQPSLTVAGAGPEEDALRDKVTKLKLGHLVSFAGRVTDEELNRLLNSHRIMIVPTRHGEGFGVVALEGIACGCVVVGSTCGGLPEAIGPCGSIFTNGDASALTEVLHHLLKHPESWNTFFARRETHLETHKPNFVVEKYLEVFEKMRR